MLILTLRKNLKLLTYFIVVVFITLGISLTVQSLLAWDAPLDSPPTCISGDPGCDQPLNVGDTPQNKLGPLIINVSDNWDPGFIVETGDVGIGTTNPDANLHIQGDTFGQLLAEGTWAGEIILGDYDDVADARYFYIDGEGSHLYLGFINDAFDSRGRSLTIDRSSQVGVNDATPDAMLDVMNNGGGDSFRVDDDTDGDSTPFIIDSGGNVGIGIINPGGKLHVIAGSEVSGSLADGFETGSISSNWTEYTSNGYGRIQVSGSNGPRGSFHVLMDSDTNGEYAVECIVTDINMSGATQVSLSFYNKEFGDETNNCDSSFTGLNNARDCVAFTCDGNTYYELVDLAPATAAYTLYNEDVHNHGDWCGTADSNFAIAFCHYDNYPLTNDGFAYDDITIDYSSGGAGGATALLVADDGKVGIGGTTIPGAELEISGDFKISGSGAFGGYTPDSGNFEVTTPTLYAEEVQVGNPPGGKMGLGTVNADQLCIDGICETDWTGVGGTSGWTDDGLVVRLTTDSDQVGIGLDSPEVGTKLHIQTSDGGSEDILEIDTAIDAINEYIGIRLKSTDRDIYSRIAGVLGPTTSDIGISFWNYYSGSLDEVMRIANNRVGIGTTTPGYELEVSGDVKIVGGASFGSGYNPDPGNFEVTTPTLYAGEVQVGDPTGGKMGWGTINADELCIDGVCETTWSGVGGTSGWTDDGLVVRLTTDSDQVGIGLDSPEAGTKLHVYENTSADHDILTLESEIDSNANDGEHLGILFKSGRDTSARIAAVVGPDSIDDLGIGFWNYYSGSLDEVMRIANNGVGIGTTSLGANKLKVQGDAEVTNDLTIGGDLIMQGSDLAEAFIVEEEVEPGDVLVIKQEKNNRLEKSNKPYDKLVAGVVSTDPAIKLGDREGVQVAMSGTVLVKVCDKGGEIKAGDMLTTSSVPGMAMKCSGIEKCFGAIIGKSLESFFGEYGMVKMVIGLQ